MPLVGIGPDSLGATGFIYTEHPQKVRSGQRVMKQVDRKSSMDRTGRVGLPGVTEDYPLTISKKIYSLVEMAARHQRLNI